MKKFGDFVVKNKIIILIISLLLIIPSVIGYIKTKVNYDILVYLPSDIETLKGQEILTDDFNMGAFSVSIVDNMSDKDIVKLEDKIREIDGVEKVVSIVDLKGTAIPIEILPQEALDKVAKGNSKLILTTFRESTSDDETLEAVSKMKTLSDKLTVGGMSTMVLDIEELFNKELTMYVLVAAACCILVLLFSLDSYLVPFLLIGNIGMAIIYNMGSNIIFGDISYITKAVAAVLQLGVTTDFSIFLYHKYEKAKKSEKNKDKAMSSAISETLVSVLGSSLTTVAGFLALCTMQLTLGKDIGLVMAKGVVLGLICVVTVFPALLLVFDSLIEKTHHKNLVPEFNSIKEFVMKHNKAIFVVFLILLIPAYLAQTKTPVYYKLDESIPNDYASKISSNRLKEEYNMVSQALVLIDVNMDDYKINQMVDELKELDGISAVLSPSIISKYGISENMLPSDLVNIYKTDKYQMIIISRDYEIASDELNNQVEQLDKIVKKYDSNAIVAGEGPLMKDLVTTTDIDFKNVNYASILVIFVLMLLVLKSVSLPILLVTAIEFAIFINMGVPYFTDNSIPFIASVVIGTIQLGATIDYAILMTTKYLEQRGSGKDKIKSVKSALNNSVTSIVVSGMCFFGATIGVGLVSKIDMISSICILLARGAIISMLVVLLIVPSILLIFDKLIYKTTWGLKKGLVENEK